MFGDLKALANYLFGGPIYLFHPGFLALSQLVGKNSLLYPPPPPTSEGMYGEQSGNCSVPLEFTRRSQPSRPRPAWKRETLITYGGRPARRGQPACKPLTPRCGQPPFVSPACSTYLFFFVSMAFGEGDVGIKKTKQKMQSLQKRGGGSQKGGSQRGCPKGGVGASQRKTFSCSTE